MTDEREQLALALAVATLLEITDQDATSLRMRDENNCRIVAGRAVVQIETLAPAIVERAALALDAKLAARRPRSSRRR